MIWEQGAYVGDGWDGAGFRSVRYDATVPLDDENQDILRIQANVGRIESLRAYKAQSEAFKFLEEANQIAADVRSPAGDALAQSAQAAFEAIATETQAALLENRSMSSDVVRQAIDTAELEIRTLANQDARLAAAVGSSNLPAQLSTTRETVASSSGVPWWLLALLLKWVW